MGATPGMTNSSSITASLVDMGPLTPVDEDDGPGKVLSYGEKGLGKDCFNVAHDGASLKVQL